MDTTTAVSAPGAPAGALSAGEIFLRGRRMLRFFDPAGYREAVALFLDAREMEPDFAPVHAALAETYSYWGFRREIVGQECQSYYELAYESALRGHELRPNLPETHRAMAVALRRGEHAEPGRRRFEAAAAMALNPYDAENCYELWRATGYGPDDPVIHKALALDPSFFAAPNDLGVVLYQADRLREAEFFFRKALAINPGNSLGQYNMAMLLASQGKDEEAMALLQKWVQAHHKDLLIGKGIAYLREQEGGGGLIL